MRSRRRSRPAPVARTPRSRLNSLPEDRKARLLDPAEAEFAEHGFEHASLNRILEVAGMSKGQAYHYISGKADLYAAVIDRALDRIVERVALPPFRATSVDMFWAGLMQIGVRVTEVLDEDDRLATLARGIYSHSDAESALREPMRRIQAWLLEVVVLGQSLGAVRKDLPAALLARVAFAAAREIDKWFAEHWDELDREEALTLNAKTFEILVAIATPAG